MLSMSNLHFFHAEICYATRIKMCALYQCISKEDLQRKCYAFQRPCETSITLLSRHFPEKFHSMQKFMKLHHVKLHNKTKMLNPVLTYIMKMSAKLYNLLLNILLYDLQFEIKRMENRELKVKVYEITPCRIA